MASPATRRKAHVAGVDLATVSGSGPGGRISTADIESVISGKGGGASKPASFVPKKGVEEIKIIGVRRVIAERMSAAKRNIPHFAYVEEVDVTELESLRQYLNSRQPKGSPSLTYLPFLVAALVRVLEKFPQCNALHDAEHAKDILAANARDLAEAAKDDLKGAFLDRLTIDKARIEAIARGIDEIAAQPDPVGKVLAEWNRPNGLRIARVSVPLGVIGIVYESRPNVTADAGALCLRSGNAAILRCGSESFETSQAILVALHEGLETAGLPKAAIQLVPTRERAAVGLMLAMDDTIDVIIPRGGRSLIERVMAERPRWALLSAAVYA